ncbi:16S rRNA (guanine(527)-N(7))-methyltransferase RsmG [Oscillatoria sp. CS-180]|uniref:16S rRNA (guanine(527)-N(7))-methyltransferase RsmG n=1 Tax=Oscillatoria sp. CS-180 TaxID=3021720 RepID=UPI00232A8ACB|nr:16S rRNA (guanine(527)-N(7))-methyltransferase RsmG [Oscillatoria sp. CS-180]MDB9526711.1 16S rRNA (guanine(527)-N(7))-methyltransferase RsmG [Oscillatoria sp. CS-180]
MSEFVIRELPTLTHVWQETLGWCPNEEQQKDFQDLYEGVLKGNQQMNLTRITEPSEFWEKHLWDSFSGLFPWHMSDLHRPRWAISEANRRVIDIGTGAGFPGLPAAIAFPHWQITLLDSTQKKIRFLQELAQSMGLKNVRVIADRAEFLGHQLSHRELYDVALLRAVGSASTCAEYALPLVKVNGIVVLYRGQWTSEDAQSLSRAAQKLGGSLLDVKPWKTPLSKGIRHCIYLQKQSPTHDDFPRPVGIPAKQPL